MTIRAFYSRGGFSIQDPPIQVINNVGNYNGGTGTFSGAVTAPSFIGSIASSSITGTTLASNVVLSSLTSLGTITSGVWNGTAIGDTYISSAATWNTASTDRLKWDGGATGLVAATGRTSLGLVIGTNVQAYSATLAAAAGGTYTGNVTGNISGSSGSCTGNAATATNVAYTGLTGTVPTWNQSTTGNAATATNVAYTGLTGTVPTWNQSTTGNAATVTNGAYKNVNNNFTALQTLTAGLKLEEAALTTTIFSQDNTADKRLEISSYYSGIPGQLAWLRNTGGNQITIGDLDNGSGAGGPVEIFDCENGQYTLSVVDSSIFMDNGTVSISGAFDVDTATGNVNVNGSFAASAISCGANIRGETITVGSLFLPITSGTATITTTAITQVTAVSLSSTTYSSVKYFIQARNTTTARFQITEIVATRNATTTVVTATPVDTNTGGVACTYAVDISSSTFRLRITPQAASSTVFKILWTAIP